MRRLSGRSKQCHRPHRNVTGAILRNRNRPLAPWKATSGRIHPKRPLQSVGRPSRWPQNRANPLGRLPGPTGPPAQRGRQACRRLAQAVWSSWAPEPRPLASPTPDFRRTGRTAEVVSGGPSSLQERHRGPYYHGRNWLGHWRRKQKAALGQKGGPHLKNTPFRAQGEVPVVSIIGMTTDGNTLGQKMSRPESATSRRPAPHFRGDQHGGRGAIAMLLPGQGGCNGRKQERRPEPIEMAAAGHKARRYPGKEGFGDGTRCAQQVEPDPPSPA